MGLGNVLNLQMGRVLIEVGNVRELEHCWKGYTNEHMVFVNVKRGYCIFFVVGKCCFLSNICL